jgi:hypothetical protein
MIDLNREIDVKAFLSKWSRLITVLTKKIIPHWPRKDEAAARSYYEDIPSAQKQNGVSGVYLPPSAFTGQVLDYSYVSGIKPRPIPVFVTGSFEPYNKHYAEWQAKQLNGESIDFNAYLVATGQFKASNQ